MPGERGANRRPHGLPEGGEGREAGARAANKKKEGGRDQKRPPLGDEGRDDEQNGYYQEDLVVGPGVRGREQGNAQRQAEAEPWIDSPAPVQDDEPPDDQQHASRQQPNPNRSESGVTRQVGRKAPHRGGESESVRQLRRRDGEELTRPARPNGQGDEHEDQGGCGQAEQGSALALNDQPSGGKSDNGNSDRRLEKQKRHRSAARKPLASDPEEDGQRTGQQQQTTELAAEQESPGGTEKGKARNQGKGKRAQATQAQTTHEEA